MENFLEGPADVIVLSTGQKISNASAKFARFCDADFSFKLYDQEYVPKDSDLTTAQVWIANAINAQLTAGDVIGLRAKLPEINKILSKISSESDLSNGIDKNQEKALTSLFSKMMDISGIKEAKATKILHKKRPALIPIFDSVLLEYFKEATKGKPKPRGKTRAEKLVEAIKIFQEDLVTNLDTLKELGHKDPHANELTFVRKLELLIWAWTGYHRPVWMTDDEWKEAKKSLEHMRQAKKK